MDEEVQMCKNKVDLNSQKNEANLEESIREFEKILIENSSPQDIGLLYEEEWDALVLDKENREVVNWWFKALPNFFRDGKGKFELEHLELPRYIIEFEEALIMKICLYVEPTLGKI